MRRLGAIEVEVGTERWAVPIDDARAFIAARGGRGVQVIPWILARHVTGPVRLEELRFLASRAEEEVSPPHPPPSTSAREAPTTRRKSRKRGDG